MESENSKQLYFSFRRKLNYVLISMEFGWFGILKLHAVPSGDAEFSLVELALDQPITEKRT